MPRRRPQRPAVVVGRVRAFDQFFHAIQMPRFGRRAQHFVPGVRRHRGARVHVRRNHVQTLRVSVLAAVQQSFGPHRWDVNQRQKPIQQVNIAHFRRRQQIPRACVVVVLFLVFRGAHI